MSEAEIVKQNHHTKLELKDKKNDEAFPFATLKIT